MEDIIEIDGAYLEGGGQIVRTSLSLSAITGKPFKIFNIRKGREKPGLKEQHVQCVNAAAVLCQASHNAKIHCTEMQFYPGKITQKKNLEIKVGTAGSTALIASVILPVAYSIDDEKKIRISGGGTWNEFAPPVLYLEKVLLPLIARAGLKAEIEIKKDGFYPKGGGDVEISIQPWKEPRNLVIDNFDIKKIEICSMSTEALKSRKVAERQADAAIAVLKNKYNFEIKKEIFYSSTSEPGSGILITTSPTLIGADNLGKQRVSAEDVGKDAALKLYNEIEKKASVDVHAADQLMIYLALAGGKIRTSEISNHARTNAYVIEKFLPVKFRLENGEIECIKNL